MTLIHTLVAFIVALGVLIVVHEYGHYLVARVCGVKVLRFSVGFGRPLLLWRLQSCHATLEVALAAPPESLGVLSESAARFDVSPKDHPPMRRVLA